MRTNSVTNAMCRLTRTGTSLITSLRMQIFGPSGRSNIPESSLLLSAETSKRIDGRGAYLHLEISTPCITFEHIREKKIAGENLGSNLE